MRFHKTSIADVILIETDPVGDIRGHFMRTFCAREMAEHGLNPTLAQSSHSFSADKGTLRGLHFQTHPVMEDRLVRCIRGAIFDVVVDLRVGSPTYAKWIGYELNDANNLQLYSPAGFAHGFQSLTNNVTVSYHIGQFYEPGRSTGVRFDDPEIAVPWPLPARVVSPRDLTLPLLAEVDHSLLSSYGVRM